MPPTLSSIAYKVSILKKKKGKDTEDLEEKAKNPKNQELLQ